MPALTYFKFRFLQRPLAAQPHDPLSAWLDPQTVGRLNRAGWLMLSDLASAIRRGGRWWRSLPGIGPTKAADLRGLLAALLGEQALQRPSPIPVQTLAKAAGPTTPLYLAIVPENAAWALSLSDVATRDLDGSTGANRAPRSSLIDVTTDTQAIQTWAALRSGSPHTAKAYLREATRWQMWCLLERRKALSSATPQDCMAYMQFLLKIPEAWTSRERAARLSQGWTPFRGQLSLSSRKQSVTILHILCTWLTQQRYLDSNPWDAVNPRLVEGDELPKPPTSRALSVEAYQVLLDHLQQNTSIAAERNRFLLTFLRRTGLRASELVAARLGDLVRDELGWQLHVIGKGRKPRSVTLTTAAMESVEIYLTSRGIDTAPLKGSQPPQPWSRTALLASVTDPAQPVSYPTVHSSFTAFVHRALRGARIAPTDLARCRNATLHWLRHTFATRFAEGGGELSVLQAELGQADPQTTSRYYRAIEQHRRSEMERLS